MFTVAQRDELRRHVLQLGREDRAVVAGAVVGSLASGTADEFSDLDLTFGVAAQVSVQSVLDDWTRRLGAEREAVPLVDLARGATLYRVFLLPDALQLDLSMTPEGQFRPAGPRFQLIFGQIAPADPEEQGPVGTLFIGTPAVAADVYGWGVVYALHARACIERGRRWQAQHYLGAVRDHALAMACLRLRVTPVQARGYDDLPTGLRRRFESTLAGTLDQPTLRSALAAAVGALLVEGAEARLPSSSVISSRLGHLL